MKQLVAAITFVISTSGALAGQEIGVVDTVLNVPDGWVELSDSEQTELDQHVVKMTRSYTPWLRSELLAAYSLRSSLFRGLDPEVVIVSYTWPQEDEFDRKKTGKRTEELCAQNGYSVRERETLDLEEKGVGVVCAGPLNVITYLFIPRPGHVVRVALYMPWTAKEDYEVVMSEVSEFLAPLWDNRGRADSRTSLLETLDELTETAISTLADMGQQSYENDRLGLSLSLPVGFEILPDQMKEERANALAGVKNFEGFELLAIFGCPGDCLELSLWVGEPVASDTLAWIEKMRWLANDLTIGSGLDFLRSPDFDQPKDFASHLYWDSEREAVWRVWNVSISSGAWIARALPDGSAAALWIIDGPGVPTPVSLERSRVFFDGMEIERSVVEGAGAPR